MKYDSFPVDSDMDTINNCLRAVEERAKMKGIPNLFNDCLCLRQYFHKEKVSPKVLKYSGRVFELAVEKPDGWEYLLFAAALKDNLNNLDDLRYDLKYGITFKNAILYNAPAEILDFVQMKCGELRNRTRKNSVKSGITFMKGRMS